jgi:hypothetical protein
MSPLMFRHWSSDFFVLHRARYERVQNMQNSHLASTKASLRERGLRESGRRIIFSQQKIDVSIQRRFEESTKNSLTYSLPAALDFDLDLGTVRIRC